MSGPGSPIRRRGFSLVELLVAMSISIVLMGAITSAILLAGQALPGPDSPAFAMLSSSDAVDALCGDLAGAQYLLERTPHSVKMVVADRDGDGTPEVIRYFWNGAAGSPLYRQVEGHSAAVVAENVHALELQYTEQEIEERYPGKGVESAETALASFTKWEDRMTFDVESDNWIGQAIRPELPADTLSYRPTRAELRLARNGTADTIIQLRTLGGDGKPTSTVLDQDAFPNWKLLWSVVTCNAWLDESRSLLPDEGVALVIRPAGTGDACFVEYEDDHGPGRLTTHGGESGWTINNANALPYTLYGRVTLPGPTDHVHWTLVTRVSIKLQIGTSGQWAAQTSVPLLNAPPVLTAFWETDFDAAPDTLDLNADTLKDWSTRTGDAFDDGDLTTGIWTARQTLDTAPACDFREVTVAEARMRSTSTTNAAILWINCDCDGSRYAPIYARLQRLVSGTQQLTLYRKTDDNTAIALARIGGLHTGFIHVRLLINPTDDTVALQIDGQHHGTFAYTVFTPSTKERFASVLSSGSGAEFDFVSIRTGGRP